MGANFWRHASQKPPPEFALLPVPATLSAGRGWSSMSLYTVSVPAHQLECGAMRVTAWAMMKTRPDCDPCYKV